MNLISKQPSAVPRFLRNLGTASGGLLQKITRSNPSPASGNPLPTSVLDLYVIFRCPMHVFQQVLSLVMRVQAAVPCHCVCVYSRLATTTILGSAPGLLWSTTTDQYFNNCTVSTHTGAHICPRPGCRDLALATFYRVTHYGSHIC